ncbi:MAG TPA: TolC family protein [Sedimentisphaerales bacterium]|nr:TolC family protein [Sedimentisphaerales bacterium]
MFSECKAATPGGGKLWAVMALGALLVQTGCKSPSEYRVNADKVATDIIREKQNEALGQSGEFSIERPSDILRRRLLIDQNLPYSSEASLGADNLKTIEHWPEQDYPRAEEPALDPLVLLEKSKPVKLSLIQALQVGARNSFDYQKSKEDIFQAALALDLQRNEFRNIFGGQVASLASTNTTGDRTDSAIENSGVVGLSRTLESGVELSTDLAITLANLLTMGGASSLGVSSDSSVMIPLLRGSGRHIVREPLTKAERAVVYAIYQFERFKQTFSVGIARQYLAVLRQLDQVRNAEENYRSLIVSARRSRRLADAGRLSEIQVDQAVQNELRARNGWISAIESYKSSLDSFKSSLSLPPDAEIELDRSELERLAAPASQMVAGLTDEKESPASESVPAADVQVELAPPSREDAGPLEINEPEAVGLALDNRFDLRVAEGGVYDAQRAVVVAADALGAELTFLGRVGYGGTGDPTGNDQKLRFDKGAYSALLTLDLPFERTRERNDYRNSFISLEQAVRNVQKLEDQIKLNIRNRLRTLLESRESLKIQAKSVLVAEKRVKSTELFLEAGRGQIQIRDLLEAQDALLSAQNLLTLAAVNYRIAELDLQSDMGLLKIDDKGLWQEYVPREGDNVKQ